MATTADLRLRVLRRLTVIDHVDAPAPDQTEVCDQYISDVRAELVELGLCWWDAEAIPDAVMPALTQYVASQAAAAFGKGGKGLDGEIIDRQAKKRLGALKSSTQRPEIPGVFY